jgi:hypothetical protein
LVIELEMGYCILMSSTSNRAPAPLGWIESLERSRAQIEAGQTVPLEPVLDRLRTSAARMEARLAKRPARKA